MPASRVSLLLVMVLCLGGWACAVSESESSSDEPPKQLPKSPSEPAEAKKPAAGVLPQRILLTTTKLGNVDTMMICFAGLDNDDKFPVAKGQKLLIALTKKHDLQNDGYFADPVFENPDDIDDAWGRPFHYEWPNTKVKNAKKPAIWSYGPNGVNENGKGDDIRNWR